MYMLNFFILTRLLEIFKDLPELVPTISTVNNPSAIEWVRLELNIDLEIGVKI